MRRLGATLLLTYALRNADCHAKNLALLYTRRADVELAPIYDMLTTAVYEGYELNPPGLAFMGKKTWRPGKHLQTFLASTFELPLRDQKMLIEHIGDAMAAVAPAVRQAMRDVPGFSEVGARMLLVWGEAYDMLRDRPCYGLGSRPLGPSWDGLTVPPRSRPPADKVGPSELLGRR